MLATYVKPRQDKLEFEEAASVFSLAVAAVTGESPSIPTLALVLAKTALETGRWGARGGLWNFGFGNIKASDKWEGLYTCIVLNEVLNGKVLWFAPEGRLTGNPAKGGKLAGDLADAGRTVPPGHPQTRMRAFPTAADGALDYVRFVGGGRYRAAWELLLAGDAQGYVHALKVASYFTADEATYAKGVLSLQREFIARLEARPAPEMPVPPPDEVREWLSEQDAALLEAQLAESRFDLAERRRASALREMSDLPDEPADEDTVPDVRRV